MNPGFKERLFLYLKKVYWKIRNNLKKNFVSTEQIINEDLEVNILHIGPDVVYPLSMC